ncbi:FAD-dependent monooxygenase [Amycolatopsis keratiniphila]|uniref:FAD-dependent monooxygenase n=1 Tax=Amycolatopsis keratiniphila TaxID=129921 RepID=UPI00087D3752|nr:FAD-dependent monooxygenase [Amycolatopsis keratiniphila]OLZ47235.1 FAD-dependent oxidoreductase [Amycolatopsis keratiniphila subsp. nogabecina]SDU38959.1 2-polyprenyl-6-methoxyphenol hydroxylase [Amycolatopsis keratiniphila]
MTNRTVLISGASIAGPALAFWLSRQGYAVTVVERSRELRSGGQAVDFKGATHRAVLERMGILDEIHRQQTGGLDQTIVDAEGRPLAVLPGEFTGGDVEIRRGDLARILYDRTSADCEYVFGDSITSLTETPDGVDVTFQREAPRRFDLVFGADGIHSTVRRLAFGPEADYVEHLGHYYALVETDETDGGPAVMYNEPGRMAATGGPKANAFFVFASPEIDYDRYDTGRHKEILAAAFEGGGWRLPELMEMVKRADDVYLDSIARVTVDGYSTGRVALLGDAAYGNTLGGFGTGLAVVAAYVIAGELAAADGDHELAFRRYDEKFLGYAKIARNANAGPFLAPPTTLRIKLRDQMFKRRLLLRGMLWVTDKFATDITLDEYPALTRQG